MVRGPAGGDALAWPDFLDSISQVLRNTLCSVATTVCRVFWMTMIASATCSA